MASEMSLEPANAGMESESGAAIGPASSIDAADAAAAAAAAAMTATQRLQPASAASTQPPAASASASLPALAVPADDGDGKPIHSLILDTGPLIKNDPPVSTLLARARELLTTPAVLAEIRDEATRTRVQTTLLPFVTVRVPRPESVRFVSDFARRTGDLGVLSRTDVQLVALAYEVDCERGGMRGLAKRAPVPVEQAFGAGTKGGGDQEGDDAREGRLGETAVERQAGAAVERVDEGMDNGGNTEAGVFKLDSSPTTTAEDRLAQLDLQDSITDADTDPNVDTANASTTTAEETQEPAPQLVLAKVPESPAEDADGDGASDGDSDSEGWITPANVKKHQVRDSPNISSALSSSRPLGAALLTSDFAMQNVALRAQIAVVSPALARITELRTWVLRCHGCFYICPPNGDRDGSGGGGGGDSAVERRFCPRCGQANLLRASCSVGADGAFRVHLKRNFQWNKRGNVYSVPKPTHGSANGKMRSDIAAVGGGKGGWGRNLILAGDQKEYARLVEQRRKEKRRDLMDDDYLPDVLSGERRGGGKIKIGAGRSVNSRKGRK